MPRTYPSAADCKRSAARTDDIVPALEAWTDRKRLLVGFEEELRAVNEAVSRSGPYPQEWKESAATMIALLPVVTSPRRMAAAVRSIGGDLKKSDVDLMRLWRRVPWAFVAFESVEAVEHDIVIVSPIGPAPTGWPPDQFWNRLPVFSPSLADLARSGFRSGIALVFWDGTVFHTYGMILTFQSFDGKDLQFFVSTVDDQDDTDEGIPFLAGTAPADEDDTSRLPVSDIIRRRPLPFLRLFAWQSVPAVSGRGGAWTFAASMIEWTGSFNTTDLTEWSRFVDGIDDFIVGENGAVGFRITADGPMYDPVVVYSEEDGVLFLRGMTDNAYARGRRAVAHLAKFSERPDVRASLSMRAAAMEILDFADVLTVLEEDVTPGEDNAASDGRSPVGHVGGTKPGPDLGEITIEQIQPVLNLLMESHNEGKDYSDGEIAAWTGVTPEQVRTLREHVEGIVHRSDAAYPTPDRFGLPPKPFHALFSRRTPLVTGVFSLKDIQTEKLNPDEEALVAEAPLLRFARWVIEQGGLPATAAGYVSPAVVRKALDEGIVTRYFAVDEELFGFEATSQPGKELDVVVFHYYRTVLETAKVLRLRKNTFEVNPDVADSFTGASGTPVAPLYHRLAEALFEHVPWDEPRFGEPYPYLRDSAGFLLYALDTLSRGDTADGDGWVNVDLLVDVFLGAHPDLSEWLQDNARQGRLWINIHMDAQFCHHLCMPLGLAEVRRSDEAVMIRPTQLFHTVFDVQK